MHDQLNLSVADMPTVDESTVATEPAVYIPPPPLPSIFECPRCNGLIHRENSAEDDCRAFKTYYVYWYCEHCDIAYDCMWTYEHGRWRVPLAVSLHGAEAQQVTDRIKALAFDAA